MINKDVLLKRRGKNMSFRTPSIYLVKADIKQLEVDVIVNASNSRSMFGTLQPGRVTATSARDLMAKYIFYTAAPEAQDVDESNELLSSCYNECFKLLKRSQCRSIAFPAISEGLSSYQKLEAAEVAMQIIQSRATHCFAWKVILCVNDDEDFEIYQKLLTENIYSAGHGAAMPIEIYPTMNDYQERMMTNKIKKEPRYRFDFNKSKMFGALAGDIIGKRFESRNYRAKDFELDHPHCDFTDDSVLTMAVLSKVKDYGESERKYHKLDRDFKEMDKLNPPKQVPDSHAQMEIARRRLAELKLREERLNKIKLDLKTFETGFGSSIQDFAQRYPMRGYGGMFSRWIYNKEPKSYDSFGNGSAMRVSACGWYGKTADEVLMLAKKSADCTHSHPEGVKGAQATALAIFYARRGKSKDFIKERIEYLFDYDLDRSCDEIRPNYQFNLTCQGTVPEAMIAFLESSSFEDAIRTAISLGGDSDTLAAITGSIAEAFYGGVGNEIGQLIVSRLPQEFLELLSWANRR